MRICFAYIRRDPEQTDNEFNRYKERLNRAYHDYIEHHDYQWGGVFEDALRVASWSMPQRPGGGKLLDRIEELNPPVDDQICLIILRAQHLAGDLGDLWWILDHLIYQWNVDICHVGAKRWLYNDEFGPRLIRALDVCSTWENEFRELRRYSKPPPKKPAPPAAAEKKRLAEHKAAVQHIVTLRDGGMSWPKIVLRLCSDGFRNGNGKEFALGAVKAAYRLAKLRQLQPSS